MTGVAEYIQCRCTLLATEAKLSMPPDAAETFLEVGQSKFGHQSGSCLGLALMRGTARMTLTHLPLICMHSMLLLLAVVVLTTHHCWIVS